MSVFIDLDQTGNWVVIYTPFRHDPFVTELKSRVPPASRRWLAEARAWCVIRTYHQTVEELLQRYYRGAELLYSPCLTAQGPMARSYATLGLTPEAPDCVVHAAYQALYKLEEAQCAYTEICKRRNIEQVAGPEDSDEDTLTDEELDGDSRQEDLYEDDYDREQEYQDEWQ